MSDESADFANHYDHQAIGWGEVLEFPTSRRLRQYSHRIYNRYPARSIFLVPRAILRALRATAEQKSELRVLDPFMGSGTTAVEATLQRALPFGVELDPFARLISDVRVRPYAQHDLHRLALRFQELQRTWMAFDADESLAPQLSNVGYWFRDSTFSDLLRLKNAIYTTARSDSSDFDFLRVVLADMIRPCSLAERQTLKPYISSKYPKTPARVGDAFEKSFETHLRALDEYSEALDGRYSPITWLGTDGTDFASEPGSIHVAITSPPYVNALDYVRCVKLESSWIDCGDDQSLAQLRGYHVGEAVRSSRPVTGVVHDLLLPYAEKISRADLKRSHLVLSYFNDMFMNLRNVHASLVAGGEYHLIVGNNIIRGVEVPTHSLLAQLGKFAGFTWTKYYNYRIKDHRTSMPRKGQGGKISVEHVISLRKDPQPSVREP